jgi:hypothetical protein
VQVGRGEFLQDRLVVWPGTVEVRDHPRAEQPLDQLARRLEPAVAVDRPEQRLERVGEDAVS